MAAITRLTVNTHSAKSGTALTTHGEILHKRGHDESRQIAQSCLLQILAYCNQMRFRLNHSKVK